MALQSGYHKHLTIIVHKYSSQCSSGKSALRFSSKLTHTHTLEYIGFPIKQMDPVMASAFLSSFQASLSHPLSLEGHMTCGTHTLKSELLTCTLHPPRPYHTPPIRGEAIAWLSIVIAKVISHNKQTRLQQGNSFSGWNTFLPVNRIQIHTWMSLVH